MNRFLLTLAVIATGAGAAHAETLTVTAPAPAASVSYADLNLNATSGKIQLLQRIRAAAAAVDREGAFVCPQTGVAVAVMRKLVQCGVIEKGARVCVISTAHGLKFASFKETYHRESAGEFANPPVEVAARFTEVRKALDQRLR